MQKSKENIITANVTVRQKVNKDIDHIYPLGTLKTLRDETIRQGLNSIQIGEEFDSKYLIRPDYRLWYTFAIIKDVRRHNANEILEQFEKGLNHENSVVFWGTLVCFVLLRYQQTKILDSLKILNLFEVAEKRLESISPLLGLDADCLLVNMRFKANYQRFIYNTTREPLSIASLEELFKYFSIILKQIDHEWELGACISLEAFKIPRKEGRSLIPDNLYDFSSNIAYALFQLRYALTFSIKEINKETQYLLDMAAGFLRSAWLLHRSLRIGEESAVKKKHRRDILKILCNEYHTLYIYCQALRSAGKFHLANTHNWYLLRTLPEELKKKSFFQAVVNNIAGSVRQAGLTFSNTKLPYYGNLDELGQTFTELEEDLYHGNQFFKGSMEEESIQSIELTSTSHEDTFRLHIQYDIEKNEATRVDWQVVLRETTPSDDPWYTLIVYLKNPLGILESASSHDLLKSLVRLAFYYDLIKSGAKLLSYISLPPAELILQLAHIIQRQCTALPLAIDKDVLDLWINSVRKGVSKANFSNEQYAIIHRALKTQLIHTQTTPPIHLIERLFNLSLTDGNLSLPKISTASGKCSTDPEILISRVKKVIYISLADFGEVGNILLFNGEEYKQYNYVHDSRVMSKIAPPLSWQFDIINKEIGKILAYLKNVIATSKEVKYYLNGIIDEILNSSRNLLGDYPEIIYFSPNTDWINLPWQYLFYVVAKTKKISCWPIISIVPSLDWLHVAVSQRPTEKCLKLCISKADDLKKYADKFQQYLNKYTPHHREKVRAKAGETSASQYIIFGHGYPPTKETPFATIVAPSLPFTIEDWIKHSGYNAYILHSCSSGQVIPLFAGSDYGGAPGLLLALRAKVVVAPCIQVHPDTALAFQFEIFEKMKYPQHTYADTYRAAVEKDERCLFYTLFGLVTLPLRVHIQHPLRWKR